jgi:hypothetical protein
MTLPLRSGISASGVKVFPKILRYGAMEVMISKGDSIPWTRAFLRGASAVSV